MKSNKKFRDLDEQILLLKQKGLLINDIEKLKWYLKSFNYQNFINGYNDFFMINNNRKIDKYKPKATSNGIIELFNFDRNISKLILGDIQNIERKIATSLAYTISLVMKENNFNDGMIFNFEYNDVVIRKIFNISLDNEWKEIQENIKTNIDLNNKIFKNTLSIKEIPIWTLVIYLSFGNLIYLLERVKNNVFNKIMFNSTLYNYQNISKIEMIEILKILKNVRNRICHNNVLYNIIIKNKNNRINIANKLISSNVKINKINLYYLILMINKLENPKNNFLINEINKKIEEWKNISEEIKQEIVNRIWKNKNHNY